ncbi:terminase [Caldimonas thermodepolymerans]|jgi:hypothetical protein|uniref:terminase small subunit-like protein n=1 Tax=Caldimonas thermodepolymerans TaxID=215580 RepID=UPI0024929EA4|nr:terminase [Caldimonas thermodepolymerans]
MSAARERTPELEDEILARLSEGEPLRAILRSDPDRFPSKSVFYAWMAGDDDLKARFEQARLDGADAIAEETLAIVDQVPERILTENGDKVDPGFVAWQKMRAEQRLKLLAKWFPQRYGDKVGVEHTGPGGGPVQTVTRIERRIVKAE